MLSWLSAGPALARPATVHLTNPKVAECVRALPGATDVLRLLGESAMSRPFLSFGCAVWAGLLVHAGCRAACWALLRRLL